MKKITFISVSIAIVFITLSFIAHNNKKNVKDFAEINLEKNFSFADLVHEKFLTVRSSGSFIDKKAERNVNYRVFTSKENLVNTIVRDILKLNVGDNTNYGVVLYYKDKNMTKLDVENIKAIGHYQIINNELIHELYEKEGTNFVVKNNYYTFQAPTITFNDFNLISRNLKTNDVVILHNPTEETFEKYDGFYIKKMIDENNINLESGIIPYNLDAPDCGIACATDGSGDYCATCDDGSPCCGVDPANCASGQAKSLKVKNNELLIDKDLYTLRNEFMVKYEIGKKYKNYYYILSKDMANLSTENWAKIAEVIPSIVEKVNLVINSKNTEILYNDSDYNKFIDIIKMLRELNKSEDFQFMLNDVEKDLGLYKNLKLEDIYKKIK